MQDMNEPGLKNACKALCSAFQGILSWNWDGRFGTVLAEFGAGKKENIRPILERSLGTTWDSSNIGNAPDIVREINNHLGGLRSGQLLFTSDPGREPFIFCAWWPWGDGKVISIRIASAGGELSDPEKAEKIQMLKEWFGI
jgi:hypothetical protein